MTKKQSVKKPTVKKLAYKDQEYPRWFAVQIGSGEMAKRRRLALEDMSRRVVPPHRRGLRDSTFSPFFQILANACDLHPEEVEPLLNQIMALG